MIRTTDLKLTEQELKVLLRTIESMVTLDEDLETLQSIKSLLWNCLTLAPNDIESFNRWVDVQQRKLVVPPETPAPSKVEETVCEEDRRVFEALDLGVESSYPRTRGKNRRNRRHKNK
jgi:hypothetical protein